MDQAAVFLFIVAFLSVVGYLCYRVIRHGGFKAAMFGARIHHTVGEVSGERQGPVGVRLRVHALRRDAMEKLVGVEFVAKSVASYQMLPVTLTVSQAQELALLLNEAARVP